MVEQLEQLDRLYEAECIANFLELVVGNLDRALSTPEAIGMCCVIRYMCELIKETREFFENNRE